MLAPGALVPTTILGASWLLSLLAASAQPAQAVHDHYDKHEAPQLVPLLCEVLRFPTVAENKEAREAQQAWVVRTGERAGFAVRNAGLVTEVTLPGPAGA